MLGVLLIAHLSFLPSFPKVVLFGALNVMVVAFDKYFRITLPTPQSIEPHTFNLQAPRKK